MTVPASIVTAATMQTMTSSPTKWLSPMRRKKSGFCAFDNANDAYCCDNDISYSCTAEETTVSEDSTGLVETVLLSRLERELERKDSALKDLSEKFRCAQQDLMRERRSKQQRETPDEDKLVLSRREVFRAIDAVIQHVDFDGDTTAVTDAVAQLDRLLGRTRSPTSIRKKKLVPAASAIALPLRPKCALLTEQEIPDDYKTVPAGRQGGGGQILLSRSTYAANKPSEDRSTVVVGDGFVFAGVYDGHGGTTAAEYTQRHVFANFKAALEGCGSGTSSAIRDAFVRAYKQTDADYLEYARQLPNPAAALFAGTCAVSCFVDTRTGRISCGNLGDSRAVMGVYETSKSGKKRVRAVPLSVDHSASSKSEQERIRNEHPYDANVVVDVCQDDDEEDEPDWRVKKMCSFSRSIGDCQLKDGAASALFNSYVVPDQQILPRPGTLMKGSSTQVTPPYISNMPEIIESTLKSGFIVIACDGVWDEMSSDEAVRICARLVAEYGPGSNLAEMFIEETLKKAVSRIAETVEGEERITLQDLKSRPVGKDDYSSRSCLHDDITVVILHFGNNGATATAASTKQAGTSSDSSNGSNTSATKLSQPLTAISTKDLFNEIDADGNGVLDIEELEMLMERIGSPLLGQDLEDCFAEMDADGDGNVNYSDFETWWSNKNQPRRGVNRTTSAMKKNRRGMVMTDAITMLSKEIERQKEDSARKAANGQILRMMDAFKGFQRPQLQILFDALDADNNHTLDKDEVRNLVSQVLKTDATPILVDTVFAEMDDDGSGAVDFEEFANYFGIGG